MNKEIKLKPQVIEFKAFQFAFFNRSKPFKEFKSIQILFELSPYINYKFGSGNIRTRLGVSYNFIKHKKENQINQNK